MTIYLQQYLERLSELITRDDADLLILLNTGGDVVGYMGVEYFFSPLDNEKVANEHHWYVLEDYRGVGSIRLIHAAEKWAKKHHCTHIIMTASNLASNLHDKVCEFYEKMGMKKFETSYIQEIL